MQDRHLLDELSLPSAVAKYIQPQPRRVPYVADKKPGRNDPCPCGSGKKFKHCHGKDL